MTARPAALAAAPPTAPPAGTPLAELIGAVRAGVRGRPDPAERARRAAGALTPFLGRADLLPSERTEPDPLGYRQHLLHAEPDFSLVALVWLPGQATGVHDHTAWCVVGVHRGAEEETRYRVETGPDGGELLVPDGTAVHRAGAVTAVVPPGDVHLVRNATDATTVSLHVYGADIRDRGTSIRRGYDLPVAGTAGPRRR
ncbi:cysteine dioxygenase [Kitasatospora sp. NPDC088134]|uniref:cysteine dioxygenase family protein n=1 Tax=Kitasatospora sp. NPDC088134 TaxID=3364071 RepID=UPI0037FBA302